MANFARDVRPGDWNCPSCNAHNFASRNECFKCRTPKPGGGGREQVFSFFFCSPVEMSAKYSLSEIICNERDDSPNPPDGTFSLSFLS